jgi:hypothetical protein
VAVGFDVAHVVVEFKIPLKRPVFGSWPMARKRPEAANSFHGACLRVFYLQFAEGFLPAGVFQDVYGTLTVILGWAFDPVQHHPGGAELFCVGELE